MGTRGPSFEARYRGKDIGEPRRVATGTDDGDDNDDIALLLFVWTMFIINVCLRTPLPPLLSPIPPSKLAPPPLPFLAHETPIINACIEPLSRS